MFAYRLAAKLGILDVDGMLSSMTARQLIGWQAFWSIDPCDESRGDLRIAQLCKMVASACGDKNAKVEHFMPFADRGARKQSAAEQQQVMVALWKETLNGRQPN